MNPQQREAHIRILADMRHEMEHMKDALRANGYDDLSLEVERVQTALKTKARSLREQA